MAGEKIAPQFITGPSGFGFIEITLTPITAVAADGTPTYGTGQDFTAYWRDVDFRPRITNRQMQPASVLGANNQPTMSDYTITLSGWVREMTGISQPAGSLNNSDPLFNLLYQYTQFRIRETKGGVLTIYWVTAQDGDDNWTREENVQQVTFARLGLANQTNPQRFSIA